MNNHGQVFLLAIMIATVFVILALAFTPAIKNFSDDARNATTETQVGLDCSNSSISKFDQASCVAIDMFNPYFTGFLIFAGIGAVLVARYMWGGA